MRTFKSLSFPLSIYSFVLFLLLNQLPRSFASYSKSKKIHISNRESQFLQKRELDDQSFTCAAQSTCTNSISFDDTVTLDLDSNAQYDLQYVINSYQQDLNINFESETMLSAHIYLGDSPSSSQILLSTNNYLLRKKDVWTADVAISREILAQNFGSILTIQVVNSNAEEQIVEISISYGGDGITTSGIAFACVGGGLLIMIALCCFIKRGKRRSSTFISRRERQSAQGTTQNTDESVIPYLTEENMDNYFPEVKFEHLKTSFAQTSCSICLEDMTQGVDCRQLYCEHIFHSDCIKLWLKSQLQKKQACCPNCNKDMLQYNSRQ